MKGLQMAQSYFLNINQNDDLITVIKKCNANFKSLLNQGLRQIRQDKQEQEESIDNIVSDITQQIENEAEARQGNDEQLSNAIEAVDNRFSDLADVATSGDYNDLINIPTPLAVIIDDVIDGTSENPVQNKVIKTALDGKVNTDSGNAGTATKLQTARSLYVNLNSEYNSSNPVTFDGSANEALPINGTLGITHGGTGHTQTQSTTTISQVATNGTNTTVTAVSAKWWGKVMQIAVTFTANAAITNGSTVFTIVSGKRPSMTSSGIDTNSTYPCTFNTNGTVVCRRALTSGSSYTFRAIYLLP